MIPAHLSKQLARRANADAVAVDASTKFAGFYLRLADSLAEAGVDEAEAEGLARDVVAGMLDALNGASHAMVAAVTATAEAARTAPKH